MKYQTVQYYLKEDGGRKRYKPTKKDMGILMKDLTGICETMLDGSCTISSVTNNLVTFVCDESVFEDYGEDVFLHPDDDGNYYVVRTLANGDTIQLGWYAQLETKRSTRKVNDKKKYHGTLPFYSQE